MYAFCFSTVHFSTPLLSKIDDTASKTRSLSQEWFLPMVHQYRKPMDTKSTSKSTSALLIFLLVLITFPFWIGLFAATVGTVGGVIGGVFGAVFGAIGGIIGALMGLITWPFKMLFGHGHWWPHFNGYTVAVIVILVFLISKARNRS